MKVIKFLLILLVFIALGSASYLYKNFRETKRRDAMIKEDEENKRVLAESSRRVSEDTRKLLRESREKH